MKLIETLHRRRLFAIFFTLLLLLASCIQRNKYLDSYVIEVDDKKGLIDSIGNVIVKPLQSAKQNVLATKQNVLNTHFFTQNEK